MRRPVLFLRVIGALLLLTFLASGAGALAVEGTTFTVNSTADEPDGGPGNGRCESASGECTLRAAIAEANAHPGPDTVAFNIPATVAGGLTGTYHDNTDFTGASTTRTDASVDFDWGGGPPAPSIDADSFSARWSGQVQPKHSEVYTFHTTSDDGVRLWVDGQQLVDNWTDHGPTDDSGQIELTAGQKYDVRMDFYENGGGATARLAWSSASQARQVIPPNRLYPAQQDPEATRTIQLDGALPALTDDGTTIDGYTQPGSAPNTDPLESDAKIKVEVRGGGFDAYDGLTVQSSNNVVRGLALYNLNNAVLLDGATGSAEGDRNLVSGCFIGTDATGTFGQPFTGAALGTGVRLRNGAAENRIGEATLAGRNVISGVSTWGIAALHDRTVRNSIVNNIVGLSPDGARVLPNRQGIKLGAGASENVVGGEGQLERNVASGNDEVGIEITHLKGTANRIVGNFVGTDLTGTRTMGNGAWGIRLEDTVHHNVIRRNVVGGNGVGEGGGGVQLRGYGTAEGSLPSNVLEENRIGIDRAGEPIPNKGYGVQLTNYAYDNRIGPGNVIAHNTGNGIEITPHASNDFNTFTRNSIYANGGFGIDLAPGGYANKNDSPDADAGPNDQLNFPILSSANTTQVTGAACAGCTVELFVADGGAAAHGEGRAFAGSTVADADGKFTGSVSGVAEGDHLTATATDAQGNTSEFSPNFRASDTYALDGFGRNVVDGWGAAEIGGGTYTLSGAASDFDVDGATGTVQVPAAGAERGAILPRVSATNTDTLLRVKTDKPAVGGPQQVLLVARNGAGNEYRAKLIFRPEGTRLQAEKFVGGKLTALSPEVAVPNPTHSAGNWYRVRAQVTGTNPTTLRMKVWPDGQAEPAAWQYTATDSEPALQTAGRAGIKTYLGARVANAPVTFGFDDYLVRQAGG